MVCSYFVFCCSYPRQLLKIFLTELHLMQRVFNKQNELLVVELKLLLSEFT